MMASTENRSTESAAAATFSGEGSYEQLWNADIAKSRTLKTTIAAAIVGAVYG